MITSHTKIYPPILKPEIPALDAVAGLFQMLHVQGVRYVHWKSNIRLGLSLQGGTDLDLLVDREHSRAFRQILLQQEIKPMLPPEGQRYPGMEHYLGFDPTSGKLFHLHVHYQLVLGEEYIKNFRLPLEEYFLQHTRVLHGIVTPVPELELVILAIRVLLKYRDRDGLKDLLSIRSPGIKKYFSDELQWLLAQTTMAQVEQTLQALSAVTPKSIVLEFLQTLQTQPRAGLKFISLRSRLRGALRSYQRNAPLDAATQYFKQKWQRRKNFIRLSPASRMTLPEGGKTIALVGVDGAGKSTLRKELVHWLSWKLDVHSYYLGSKQPSQASSFSYLLYRVLRRSQQIAAKALGEQNLLSRWLAKARQTSLYRHHIYVGKDRQRRYLAGIGKSAAGSIVIFDRFPLSSIPGAGAAHHLDGPQIHHLAAQCGDQDASSMMRVEDGIYAVIQPPDALFLLMVSPQVSMQRKPDHREAAIEEKYQTLSAMAAQQIDGAPGSINNLPPIETNSTEILNSPKIILVNAELELQGVIQSLKGEIWKLL